MEEMVVLNSDSKAIQYLCAVDKRFEAVFFMVGDITYQPHSDGYRFLVNQIVGQMLSNKVAKTLFGRLEELCNGNICPENINRISDNKIREIGLARSKVSFIRELTRAVECGNLVFQELKELEDSEVMSKLMSIKGIGSWSAKMYLIFVLDRQDVLPYEDVAFLQSYGWLYKTSDYSKIAVEKKCNRWKPYSTIAARYMYRALDMGMTKQPIALDYLRDGSFLRPIRNYLLDKGLGYNTTLTKEIELRKNGKQYTFRDHIRAMVYSMLSNQTKWHRIHSQLPKIDKIFFDYDSDRIIAEKPDKFCNQLFDLKCGNVSTAAQMKALAYNISIFRNIEKEYGNIDAFITSDSADIIVQKLSKGSSPFKLKMLGEALTWEYLRNVGIDGAKPDTHLRRFFGADRMGIRENSPATVKEVNEQVSQLSESTGLSKIEIDNLIWSFCAEGFGEVCTATPHCLTCPISSWCNKR